MKILTVIFKQLTSLFNSSVFSGVYELKIPLDNSVILSYEAFNFAAGQYKKIAGKTLGPFCDVLYEKHLESEIKSYFSHSNFSIKYGDCPINPQILNVNDYAPEGLGEYLPDYVPGSERWKVTLWFTKDEKFLGGFSVDSILRDNQKLFDSKFG